ncbi:MAG: TM2 domain-containing membrane protein YozV [Rhodothermales bacterium]|jgi:TM2 domain-containing membrane protein YozV
MPEPTDTHSKAIGYVCWILGFTGAHRFYFGKPISGLIWALTGGLLGVGWFIDLFLIPSMDRQADRRFNAGVFDYTIAWLLLTFLGYLGAHRFYQRKWLTAVLYLCTGGCLGIGYLYDMWTLNDQISELNGETQ